jgi:hypothetical protein
VTSILRSAYVDRIERGQDDKHLPSAGASDSSRSIIRHKRALGSPYPDVDGTVIFSALQPGPRAISVRSGAPIDRWRNQRRQPVFRGPGGNEVATRDSILLAYFVDAGPIRILRSRGKRLVGQRRAAHAGEIAAPSSRNLTLTENAPGGAGGAP